MSRRKQPTVLVAFLTIAALLVSATAAQAAPSTPPAATPSPIPSYDPGPRPVSLVNLCAINLRRNPPLYQQANAPLAIAPNEVSSVITTINNEGTPIFVSILDGPGERANGMSREIQEQMRTPGTFLTIIGTVYDSFSTEFDAQPLLTQAFAEQRSNGTAAVITRFAQLSGEAAQGPIPTPDFIAWRPTIILFVIVFGAGFAILIVGWRRKDDDSDSAATPAGAVDVPESS